MKENLVDIPEQILDDEAEEILRELAKAEACDPELASLKVTEEMAKDFYDRLNAETQEKETENVQKNLPDIGSSAEDELLLAQMSEEGREAYLLGKELLARRRRDEEAKAAEEKAVEEKAAKETEEKHPRRRVGRKSRRIYVAVALAAMLVLAFGITSFGGRTYVMDMINQVTNGINRIAMDSEESEREYSESNTENVYSDINQKLGINAVIPDYLPYGCEIDETEIDEEMQIAYVGYTLGEEGWVRYYIYSNHRDQSIAVYRDDELISEEEQIVSNVSIKVSEYQNSEGVKYYVAGFVYDNANYQVVGQIEKREFEKILKNLFFV